jgi:NitT/TauT family transport system substrate-binding protein
MVCRRLTIVLAAFFMLSSGSADAADRVVFSLNWVPYGLHYGIFVAEALGYYRDANLDVDIQRGYGSGDTVKRIATGSADLGMADMASVIAGRGNGFLVKQLAVVLDRSADAIFYVKGIGVDSPKGLEGHTIGATAGETSMNLFPVFAANSGFDNKKVEFVNLAAPAKFPALVSKKVDSIVAFTTEEPAIQSAAIKAGVEIGRFLYSDYGVDYYSIGLIASDDTLAKKSDLIKRLVDATMRGYAWAIKNPDAAADAYAKRFPESSRDLTLAQWKITIGHMVTERTRANGLGYIDRSKMEKTLNFIKQYQRIEGNVAVDDIYSSKFLSKVAVEQ